MDFPVAEVSIPAHLASPPELVELKKMRGSKEKEEGAAGKGIRYKAIRQEALRVGAQTGLAYRYSIIMTYLKSVEPKLNVTYSFNGFVRDGRLLVPAIIESPNQFVMDQQTGEARVIRNAYTIEEEAKIISVVPTWRDYLWQEYAYPDMPHSSLLPRTDAEVVAWEQALDEGWKAGISQADSIFEDRKAQLEMAVAGRYLYTTLESKKMINPAALRVEANQVTFNGRTMNVGENIFTIQSDASYTAAKSWKPVWTR